jgi:septal ring factor EnvC (AmiA/AmiB activator)
MKKKIVAGALVVIIALLGWNVLKDKLNLGDAAIDNATQPPVTTTEPTILDSIKSDIAKVQQEVIANRNNDAVIQAKLDQLIKMIQTLEAEVAALKK